MSPAFVRLAATLVSLLASVDDGRAQGACPASASVHVVAEGWPGATGIPQLIILGLPITGGPHVQALLEGAPPFAPGLLLLDVALDPLTLPSGPSLALGSPLVATPFAADSRGTALLQAAPFTQIDPFFCGLDAFLQLALVDGTAVGGWSLTDCVMLHFGEQPGAIADLLPTPSWAMAYNPADAIVADLTGDGVADLAATCWELTGSLGELGLATRVGQENGSYGASLLLPWPGGALHGLAAGDLDGDGDGDLVAARQLGFFPEPLDGLQVVLSLGDGTLQPTDHYATGWGADEPVLGDLDGDGVLDAVVMNRTADTISVLAGVGDGTLGSVASFGAFAPGPTAPALDDVDGDGLLDLILLFDDEASNPDLVGVHLGLGDGSFAPIVTVPTIGQRPRDLAVGDLSGDGFPEFVTANTMGKSISVLVNAGGATFAPTLVFSTVGDVTRYVDLADLDGDAVVDVAIGNPGTHELGFRHGHGNGWIAEPQTWQTWMDFPVDEFVADLDGDGAPDLVAHYGSSLHALTGNGAGDFAAVEPLALGVAYPYTATAFDTDLDGLDDLLIANGQGLNVVRASGAGAFAAPRTFFDSSITEGLEVGDVDANGFDDVVGVGGLHPVLLLNGGASGFFEAPLLPGASPGGVSGYPSSKDGELGDFDADGALDLAVAWSYHPAVDLQRGDGTGSFQFVATVLPSGPDTTRAEVADFDGDGLADLAVAQSDSTSWLRILRGDGSFGFAEAFATPVCGVVDMASGRLDADASTDLVVVTGCASLDAAVPANVLVVAGSFDGNFEVAPVVNTGLYSWAPTVRDMDSDGVQDLVCYSVKGLVVMLGDGLGGFAPPRIFGVGAPSNVMAVGDFDGDGFRDALQLGSYSQTGAEVVDAVLLRHRHP